MRSRGVNHLTNHRGNAKISSPLHQEPFPSGTNSATAIAQFVHMRDVSTQPVLWSKGICELERRASPRRPHAIVFQHAEAVLGAPLGGFRMAEGRVFRLGRDPVSRDDCGEIRKENR